MSEPAKAITIYVDADSCPVKAEIYRVAERCSLKVYVVCNSAMAVPRTPLIERIVVGSDPDAADDWIAERVSRGAIIITADVPFQPRDRAIFLSALDLAVVRLKRDGFSI
ncbi:MAG: DUF188 domain-containing protein [Rhodomicrobium sp.]